MKMATFSLISLEGKNDMTKQHNPKNNKIILYYESMCSDFG